MNCFRPFAVALSLPFAFSSAWADNGGVNAGDEEPAAAPFAATQYFKGFMAYTRLWLGHDRYTFCAGGGAIKNPGRYLVLMPPINGATAFSGTPYFTENPADPFQAWDMRLTADYMPQPFITFRAEYNHRHASVPYFAGSGGVTPPGGNQGAPGSQVTIDGQTRYPDLVKDENRFSLALTVKL